MGFEAKRRAEQLLSLDNASHIGKCAAGSERAFLIVTTYRGSDVLFLRLVIWRGYLEGAATDLNPRRLASDREG